MACGSCGQGVKLGPGAAAPYARGTGTRTLYKVVAASGKTAFQTHDPDLARKVRNNYPGAAIEPDPDAAPTSTPAEAPDVVVSVPDEPTPEAAPAEAGAAPKTRKRA